ncbi:hypothetical protein [Fischerella thermalis]|uniref:Uncharacterized protein n=1 Tax=Fischerella thermalis CCMEE 5318 TaxID=2019666 RepID=A0A2N6LA48_9CYAN|nr:hypothetical protein [Fischerella thermalis]PMB15988.1 hypothetical protein CEN47_27175 [Fischerella thermalis CCMEE 5319]PMB19295.1 hypothetical protein CEN46_18930 [Fischerella thermalis CCMEE 5318]
MNSNSESASSNNISSHRLADIIGTIIGVLTLILPLLVIANYSSANIPNTQPSFTYNLKQK